MKRTSEFIDKYYLTLIGLVFLSAVLPLFHEKTFNSNGIETSSEINSIISFESWGLFLLPIYIVLVLTLLFAYFMIRTDTIKKISFLKWIPSKSFLILPLLSVIAIIYFLDVGVRLPIIIDAYGEEVAFGNVVAPGIGYYSLLASFVMIVVLFKLDHKTQWETVKLKIDNLPSTLTRYSKSPLFIQYITFHVAMLGFMMISYSLYFGTYQFWNGISYYTELFYYYGLNGNETQIPWYLYWEAWIILPVAIFLISIFFFISSGGGFAPNGAPLEVAAPENEYLTERQNFVEWAFFNHDVPFAENWYGSANLNLFYISLLLTGLFALILGAFLARKYGYELKSDSFYKMLGFQSIIIWRFAYSLAIISAPVFVLWGGLIESALFERGYNRFILYRFLQVEAADFGYYNPLSTFWILFFFAIPVTLFARYLIYLFKKKSLDETEN